MSYWLVGIRAGFVPLMLRDLINDEIVDKSLAPGKDDWLIDKLLFYGLSCAKLSGFYQVFAHLFIQFA